MISLKLKASSIVETVIAITIIALCSLIATLVFTNVIHSTAPIKKYEFEFELEKIIEQTISKKEFTNDTYRFEEFTILKEVEHNSPSPGINKITFMVKMGRNAYHYNLLTSNIE